MTVCHYNIETYFISELSYCCASANQQKRITDASMTITK